MARASRRALPPVSPPASVLRLSNAVRRGLATSHRRSTLPLVHVLEQVIGMVEVPATAAFVELGIPEQLADGPRTAAEVATAVGADPDGVERLLHFLATRGLVKQVRRRASGAGTWRLTASGDLLRADHRDSIRDWALFLGSRWQLHAWEHLADGVRDPSRTPFELAHGKPYFDALTDDAERGSLFDRAMRSTSRLQGELLARALDLRDVGLLCDVGGGTGAILARLLQQHPHLRGRLVDLPDVVARAGPVLDEAGVADRVDLVGGDMFEVVPAGADRYLLSAIVHDWDDGHAIRLLQNVRQAMTVPDARAIVVELELPTTDTAPLERAYDLLMLVLGGGRERTRSQFEELYAKAGLRIDRDLVLGNGWHAHHLVPVQSVQVG